MDSPENAEGPVLLQLRRWDPSLIQFDLSEFREAFLSPTRELLLLLSYQSEALLLPVSKGDSYGITHECCKYEQEDVNSLSARRSASLENIQSTSESVEMVSNNSFLSESKVSQSNSCPFISGVKSFAWGLCGDTYKQDNEAPFREFLFVVGGCDVTIHAFRVLDEIKELVEPSFEAEQEKGRWVQWWPSDLSSQASGDDLHQISTDDARGSSSRESSLSHSASALPSKIWLKSFLTSVKTIERDGSFWTCFPKLSELPSSASVVSFCISFNDSLLSGFCSSCPSVLDENSAEEKAVHRPVVDVCESANQISLVGLASDRNGAESRAYSCFKVFSSSFYDLIGFVLSSGHDTHKLIVVASVGTSGLHWLYSVKLPQGSDYDWVDFQLSDKFLISLSSCGFILLHTAVTGEYIVCLDMWQINGVKLDDLQECFPKHDNGIAVNEKVQKDVFVAASTTQSISRKTRFQRLIVNPYSSLLAIIDKYGVVHVICVSDHVPGKYITADRLLPDCLRVGSLAPWSVGSCDVSQQKVLGASFIAPSKSHLVDPGNLEFQHLQNWHSQGMFSKSNLGVTRSFQSSCDSRCSCFIRKAFLPIARLGVADSICFSPLGITRLIRRDGTKEKSSVVHTSLYVESKYYDENCLNNVNRTLDLITEARVGDGDVVGCIFQGCLYLVTKTALSVVLPTVSVSSNIPDVDWIHHSRKPSQRTTEKIQTSVIFNESKQLGSPWQVAVLDRVLLYEGPDEADCLCLENGWDLKISRLRRLQLALLYLKFEEMEPALEVLAELNIAEEGVVTLIFAAIHMMVNRGRNDAEVSAALRILVLATRFTIKTLRQYAVISHQIDCAMEGMHGTDICPLPLSLPCKEFGEYTEPKRLHEMAYYLEIIRSLQCQLATKFERPGQPSVDDWQEQELENESLEDYQLLSFDAYKAEKSTEDEHAVRQLGMGVDDEDKLALMPVESLVPPELDSSDIPDEVLGLSSQVIPKRNLFPLENPKEMFARWGVNNLDLKNVVKDALSSGRLPLAVLQLHLYRVKDLFDDKKGIDAFAEVREIGRAIAYELLLEGETALAVATLQKLGEDIEISLKQLLFGTVSRSLRKKIAEEVKKYGFLRSYELAILEKISLIERVYPCSKFWETYTFRKKNMMKELPATEAPGDCSLQLSYLPYFNNLVIECGDIDGVVSGSWVSVPGSSSSSETDEDRNHAGYWAAATVWLNAWDQTTVDRILLDQPSLLGVHVRWESEFEYHTCHNNWQEVSELLYMTPNSSISKGSLLISLDGLRSTSSIGCGMQFPDYGNYVCSPEDLDTVCIEIPYIRIFHSSADITCSPLLRNLISKELAKRFIFLKEFWDGTTEFVHLLARSGFLDDKVAVPMESMRPLALVDSASVEDTHPDTLHAVHKIVLHHCAQNNLPYFLDLYLDYYKLALDKSSILSLQEAAGDFHWAKWLLYSRVRGHEYDASFFNARAILARSIVSDNSPSVLEANEIISTVDDIAEAGWVMASLATLMFSPLHMQDCLSNGSVKMSSSSSQCTLENLRPVLQQFPTLWRMLVTLCLGQNADHSFWGLRGRNALSVYMNWRADVFYSSEHDTSLLQMVPCWFPKHLRRLIQLFVQGPLGWHSLAVLPAEGVYLRRDMEFRISNQEFSDISAVSWEAAIQKQVEQELYPSSVEENGIALEQHLHRGRALAAFNELLSYRVQKLKTDGVDRRQSSVPPRGQINVQSDVQLLLAPLTQIEQSLLSSVMPLAITHYQDSVLVASCAFLLELCGLSASLLRIDVAALKRIHCFYKSNQVEQQWPLLSSGTPLHGSSGAIVTDSLAQALADFYHHHQESGTTQLEGSHQFVPNQQPPPLILVLQHLEKASLPPSAEGKTCGSWLLSGDGDGNELRSRQKAESQQWNLVSVFCQMHQIPLSTGYLAYLARDNDWVGFLSEAQIGGYQFDVVVQVAAQEVTDPRLRTHILTVLKGMQLRKNATVSPNFDSAESSSEYSLFSQSISISAELFQILAHCEKQKQPGKALLLKAKELSWSLLAIIASCFSDVAPLSCLTAWLEITAARETSSIRESDIASLIAKNVGAAVEASNSLPAGDKVPAFHYNRKNPKRRRLMDHMSDDFSAVTASNNSSTDVRVLVEEVKKLSANDDPTVSNDSNDWPKSLPELVAVLCRQHQFVPLLRGFDMFLPSCSLLPFIRALQAFSQMRLSEASAHLESFSLIIKEEPLLSNLTKEAVPWTSWISSTAVKAADAILSTCPSPYEKRCLLKLLASTDFGDGGSSASYFRRQYWQINLAEPALRNEDLHLGDETLDDSSLLAALENNGYWEHARSWARQLEASGGPWKSAVHHVTERQAESMVREWKEFLWDVLEERVALWQHCQSLFIRYSFPALQAGLFFLKHADALEKELPPRELHSLLLLSLQWLSGMITESTPVCPLHLLREIETRVWLFAVESEAQSKSERGSGLARSDPDQISGTSVNIVDQTAELIARMDNHISLIMSTDKADVKESNGFHQKSTHTWDAGVSTTAGAVKTKRRTKVYGHGPSRRSVTEIVDRNVDSEESSTPNFYFKNELHDENLELDASFSSWDDRVGPAELERAVLSLLEFGQLTAAKQLQRKLSSGDIPVQLKIVDASLRFAELSTPQQTKSKSTLDDDLCSIIDSYNIQVEEDVVDPLQVLENLSGILAEGNGPGLCQRIIAVVKAANVLCVSFKEAFQKQPAELLQLLSLKAQDSYEEARLLVQTHPMPATIIAKILAESFLKGLVAAHRGGYMDSQKEEGPSPLLWRFSDFLKWADLCPSEQQIGHALMRLVITGQDIPHACEVELLILSHHFYQSSACLDGVDVLVALAATRVEAYVSEGDFSCLARLITGVGNFHALNFIFGILIENGQLDLLLQKYSAAADANTAVAEAVRGFRMAVVTALKHFNPNDYDAFAMVYNHFDMKHETALLLESRAEQSYQQWHIRHDKDQNEDLLESMCYYIEAAEVHSSIDAGNKTRYSCAQASLVSLQIRMPDIQWLNLSETNARCLLVEQSRFQEALIVAEAYKLNQPSEWTPVLWNQMLKPEVAEQFVAEFVAVLPLHQSMLIELAKFYRSEMVARVDQSHFSVWLTGGGLPAEWAKYLGRSFKCLLKRTRDVRCRLQMASIATGFNDVVETCNKALDKVPENAGPLVLRKGHGGAYLPLM